MSPQKYAQTLCIHGMVPKKLPVGIGKQKPPCVLSQKKKLSEFLSKTPPLHPIAFDCTLAEGSQDGVLYRQLNVTPPLGPFAIGCTME